MHVVELVLLRNLRGRGERQFNVCGEMPLAMYRGSLEMQYVTPLWEMETSFQQRL